MNPTTSEGHTLSQRESHIPRSKVWRMFLWQNKWGILLVCFVVLPLLVFLPYDAIRQAYPSAPPSDIANTPQQVGNATVMSKNTPSGNRRDVSSGKLIITFQLNKRLVLKETFDSNKWTLTTVGTTVPVTYRLGTAGSLYIDDWQPKANTTQEFRWDDHNRNL